jgi:hypothetical protein
MSYAGKYSAGVVEDGDEDDPREVKPRAAELDRKTESLLKIASIAGRLAAGQAHERPTRQELDALDGLYADVTGMGVVEGEKKVRTVLI